MTSIRAAIPAVIVGSSTLQGTGVFAAREFAANETVLLIDDSRAVDGRNPLQPELDAWFVEEHKERIEALFRPEAASGR